MRRHKLTCRIFMCKVMGMTTKQAEALGRAAFAEGRGNFPFADPQIAAATATARVGEKTDLLRAFNRGWTAANLAALA